MKIQFYTKHVFGQERAYIVDANQAANVKTLTGGATLIHQHQKALEGLGFTFEQVLPPSKGGA